MKEQLYENNGGMFQSSPVSLKGQTWEGVQDSIRRTVSEFLS